MGHRNTKFPVLILLGRIMREAASMEMRRVWFGEKGQSESFYGSCQRN